MVNVGLRSLAAASSWRVAVELSVIVLGVCEMRFTPHRTEKMIVSLSSSVTGVL